MNGSRFDAIARALTDGAITRRSFTQTLGGAAIASGLALAGLDDAGAARRGGKKGKGNGNGNGNGKKGNGKKRRGKGDNGGGNDRCRFETCEGECVDLDNDDNNCGSCGRACEAPAVCVSGFCAFVQGSRGDDINQFDDPLGITVDFDGRFFVADGNNRRVQRIQPGAFNGPFGELGEEDGQFLRPVGVMADNGDRVFVTDIDRHRVQRFNVNGAFQLGSGSFGSGIGQYNSPHGIAFNPRVGQVFVADTGNHSIQRLNRDLFPLERIGRQGSGEGQFNFPKGIVVARQDNIVVADTGNHRIQVLDLDGKFVRAFGRQGSGDGEFNTPIAVAVSLVTEDIFVVDQGNNRVQQFTRDGQFLKSLGRFGSGVGEFDEPFGIAVDFRDIIAVADTGNDRVQFFLPASLTTARVDSEHRRGADGGSTRRRREVLHERASAHRAG